MGRKKGAQRSKTELDESWIDAEHESSDAAESEASTHTPSLTTSRSSNTQKATRRPAKSSPHPEPQFIMPSLQGSHVQHRTSDTTVQQRPPQYPSAHHESQLDTSRLASEILAFILDVVGRVFGILKMPIALILAVWLLLGLLTIGRNVLVSNVYNALSPVCNIPGVSMLGFSICDVSGSTNGRPNKVHFDEVVETQSRWETILDKTADGVGLPADMKYSEASMRDLRTLVKYSQLKSRNELELELTSFIETARQAAMDLGRYGARVGGAADSILSTTRWTQRVILSIEDERQSQWGAIGFISNTVLAPFQPLKNSETRLVQQYVAHMAIVQGKIDSLLTEGMAMLNVLENLENRLEVIHDISTRDKVSAQTQKDELLAELWTMLGGNRAKLNKLDAQRKILGQVNHYRKTAFAQVSGTIVELKKMDDELQELRERVGEAEVATRSQPLDVHIESLELGVKRLEERRTYQRSVEGDNQRAILDRQKQFIGQGDGHGSDIPEIEAR